MPHLEVGMVQRLITADALGWVEAEHLGKKIDCKGVGVREERGEGNTGLDWERPDIVLGLQNND